MEGRMTRLLAATAAALAVGGLGFTTGAAGADGDPVAGVREAHEEMHEGHAHMGAGHHGDDIDDMDDMHAEMSRRRSPEDRELHDRMHQACSGATGRTDT